MENTNVKTLKERIAAQSKTIIIMAKVARIILYVMLGIFGTMLAASLISPDASIIKIFGLDIKLYSLMGRETIPEMQEQLVKSIIMIGLSQALLYFVTALFTKISESDTPFTLDIARRIKTIGILLGVAIALDNIYLGIVVAFVVYAIALIFSYGAELQRQVDETL
ncbi:MAG: hypothetical protein PHI27_02100 [Eubacteriales bacterium]|nr:hypothetical protein [Eubacteriales bacterium]MDD3881025.1 hypothetical protein [Eubacteriales bacterium]MDD4511906.1 hypothetical protein [Eubacteriales bacterium]